MHNQPPTPEQNPYDPPSETTQPAAAIAPAQQQDVMGIISVVIAALSFGLLLFGALCFMPLGLAAMVPATIGFVLAFFAKNPTFKVIGLLGNGFLLLLGLIAIVSVVVFFTLPFG